MAGSSMRQNKYNASSAKKTGSNRGPPVDQEVEAE